MLLLLLIPGVWVLVTMLVLAICRAAARGDGVRPPHWHGTWPRETTPGAAHRPNAA